MTNVQRRAAIINAAEKIFASKGFHIATMDEIASASDIAKGTLYLYFKNKDDLLFSILEQRMIEHNDELNNGLSSARSLSDAVNIMIDKHIEFLKKHHHFFKLNLVEQCKMDVREGKQFRVPVMEKHKEMLLHLANQLKASSNKLTEENARSLILTIIGACHAHLLDYLVTNNLKQIDNAKFEINRIVMPYVLLIEGGQA